MSERYPHDVCPKCGAPSVPFEGVPDQSLRGCLVCSHEWFEDLTRPATRPATSPATQQRHPRYIRLDALLNDVVTLIRQIEPEETAAEGMDKPISEWAAKASTEIMLAANRYDAHGCILCRS